ncbi:hypothetical protein SAMN05216553_120120 [Lentzea fradiae]|uniref:Agenet domain-containing protein n=1 Tax=Lentzea fradiae TaxID=200378 RepID=A0A1G8BY78_9PSEU|nr:hypothetical protein [Lentzea fradiae]SDH38181.1 hypothetical protein SAMN05216553_120120 [Lentzea fradiae]
MREERRRHLSVVRDGDPAPGTACLVHSDDEWWPGTVTWEDVRRADGLWWGEVTYRRDGVLRTEVHSQHDLRAR